MTKPRVIGVIPARYASVRLPGKMLEDVHGKPLIVRTFEMARQAKSLDQVIVATDDERIAKAIQDCAGTAILTDPSLPSGSDRALAALKGIDADIVVNIQGDEPLLPPVVIDETVDLLLQKSSLDITTASAPLTPEDFNNPNVVKIVVANDNRALYFSRAPIPFPRSEITWINRDNFLDQKLFRRHIGIYIFRREALELFCATPPAFLEQCEKLEQLRMLSIGMTIGVADMGPVPPGVDTQEDLDKVRSLFEGE